MALTLSELQALRDKLFSILAGGVTDVMFEGRKVTYADYASLKDRLGALDKEIAKAQGVPTKSYSYGQFSKDGRGNQ